MSLGLDITTITDLAKQSGRLDSDKQWVLADALASLTPTQITQVAVASGRNESTLLQYARAAERWAPTDRVEGVSFSAHRVALSWHDPRQLLIDLKAQHGSPTVEQVREAMGLAGHPGIELLNKGIKKLDRQVSATALRDVVNKLEIILSNLDSLPEPTVADVPTATESEEPPTATQVAETQPEPTIRQGTWTPPIRTSDVAGI